MFYINAKKYKAQAMVEFALVVSIFLVLVLGFIEFARYIHAKYTIIEAARVGADTLAKASDTLSSEEMEELLRQTVVQNAASLDESAITGISYEVVTRNGTNFIDVTVDYNVKTITPVSFLYGLLGARVDTSGDTVFPIRAVVRAKKEETGSKVCPNCGITVPANAKYCPNCGTAL